MLFLSISLVLRNIKTKKQPLFIYILETASSKFVEKKFVIVDLMFLEIVK